MTERDPVGRRVRGIVGLASRSLAVSFEDAPRLFLWIHIERKAAWFSLAPDLPTEPDPGGSRFRSPGVSPCSTCSTP